MIDVDGMKRLAATNVVAQGPHKQTNAVESRKWRPAVVEVVNCSPYIREWMSRERLRETTGEKRKKGRISSGDEHGGHE